MLLLISLVINLVVESSAVTRCGQQLASPFIKGGEDVAHGEFPWKVEIGMKVENSSQYRLQCGGTIIDDNWVLTAGHCLSDSVQPADYVLFLGLNVVSADTNLTKYQVKVKKVIIHEDFAMNNVDDLNKFYVRNDIGLIEFDLDDLANKPTNSICLPDTNVTMTNDCWTVGYGLKENSTTQIVVKKLSDWVRDNKRCSEVYLNFNASSQLCVGGRAEGGKGPCNGDSGNAFQCKAIDGRFYQLGITSYTKPPCGLPNVPDVFTRVTNYFDWIKENIKKF